MKTCYNKKCILQKGRDPLLKPHQTDFSKGNVYRNILEVAIPMTLAQLLNLMYNVVDRMYIGRIPDAGALALTGVGICFPIIALVSAFTHLFGNGGSPLCSMARGKGDLDEAEKLMGNTFSMLLLSGALVMVVGYLFYKPILYAFGASDTTFSYAADYILIYLLGTPFVMISVGMNPFINSQGFGSTGMLTVLIGAVLNIILDPLLIFAFGLGVRGAAIATVLSQMVSAIWVLRFLTGKQAVLRLNRRAMVLSGKRVGRITALGFPNFVMGFTNSLVQVTCNSTLQSYGGDIYVGVMTVLTSTREIISMPVSGLTSGASPVMSFNYGEGAYDRVKKSIRFITVVAIVYMLITWGIVSLIPEFFIRIFSSDPELITKGVPSMHIYYFGFCFMGLQMAGQNVFVALGKAKKATFFSLLRKAFIVVPLTLLLPRIMGLGVDGVFWAEPISNVIGGCACFFTMMATVMPELNGKKKAKRNIQ